MSETIPRYRQILRQELPAHYFKPDSRSLFWLLPHAAVIGLGIWLLNKHFTWWSAPFLAFIIGHSFGCMGFVAHEICHGGGIKNKKLQHFLTGVAFSPFGIGAFLWSEWHNATHHSHTQSPEMDPDRLFTMDEYRNSPVMKKLYKMSPKLRSVVFFAFFSMLMTQHNITMVMTYLKNENMTSKDRFRIWAQLLIPKVLWIGGTLMFGWQVLVFGYLLPLLVGNSLVIGYISTNHFLNPLADHDDVLASSLSVTLPKWLDFLHGHFGAHVAHHLFPHAPTRYTRKIEKKIAELWPDRYHEMSWARALKLLWETPWIYGEDGKSLEDPTTGTVKPTLGHGL